MLNIERIGAYAITFDDEGVKLARTGRSTVILTHEEALQLADFLLAHRMDLETIQRQHRGEIPAPPSTEPE